MAQRSGRNAHGQRGGTSSPLMISISGCRGVVGGTMTPVTVCRYVAAVGSWLFNDCGAAVGDAVALGRDGRAGGDALASVAAAQLRAAGLCAIDLGVVATPTVGVAVMERRAAGGIVITASHNPAQWNGLKPISRAGRAPSPDEAQRIIDLFHDRAPVALQPVDRLGALDADGAATHGHVARVLDALEGVAPIETIKKQRFRVAVDSVNASGRVGARLLLDALGCELTHLNTEETGVFPHAPEPTRENLSSEGGLCDAVRQRQCDVGFAQDPDADRLAIIDQTGAYIGEECTLALAAWAALSASHDAGGAVLAVNLSTSRMIDDVAAKFGARVVRTAVGETHVASALAQGDGLIGGEGNGGVIWPAVVMIRDSLSAMALTLALMAQQGKRISELRAALGAYAMIKRKTPMEAGAAARAVDAIAAQWSSARVDRRDGVRVDLDDQRAWLHVRPSNTEPILRLIVEAPDEAAAASLIEEAERVISTRPG